MTKNDRTLDNTVGAVLSLKENQNSQVLDGKRGYTAVLVGDDWKHHVKSTFFGVKDSGNRIVCEFLGVGKVWVLKVEEGCSTVDQVVLQKTESTSLMENSSVKIGSLRFRFIPLLRIERTPKSYKKIIIEAINSSPNGKLSLAEIYRYFERNYGFAQEDSATWKNSIRHNLSINNMFQRVPRENGNFSIKGMLWTIQNSKEGSIHEPHETRQGMGMSLARTFFRRETDTRGGRISEMFFEPPRMRDKKRKLSEDEYPRKKFKQTVIPRVTGYMSVPVSYACNGPLPSKGADENSLPDISYEIPDFPSEYSSEIFSCNANSDRQDSHNSHNDVFDMSENEERVRKHRPWRGRRPPR